MICPECGSEYREGFTQCADCGVALVEPEPEIDPGEPEMELVKVFDATNAAIMPLVESVLVDANIQYMTKGEVLQNLFGIGRLGMANNTIGPSEVWVRKDDEAEALALIAQLEEPIAEEEEEGD